MSLVFAGFVLNQERRQLLRGDEPVPVETKAYELLSLLVIRRPRVLSKTQIRDVLWPGTSVGETSLPRLVAELRQALGDDAQRPRFIRTAHGFGYAFCGEAHEDGHPEAGEPAQPGVDGRGAAGRTPTERPYPGLQAFTESEAEQFFGREAEVASLWEKVRGQKLLALIGPSGVGKTSFVRAGVLAHRPEGWSTAYLTPGASPIVALARELAPRLAGAPAALADLVQGVAELAQSGDAARVVDAAFVWRRQTREALLVVDQFEELFTLNTEETQARFASLLGRMAEEVGVRVLLCLRDDFLFQCSEQASLGAIFHDLTPLTPPCPEALRRALVEPAARRGVHFEDEALVDEMVEVVAKERGALPLLAFAASRLWEERDRERKLLTRAAYERIGGVPGALVQHAESTLAEVGPTREGAVRELFRNLATAEGTRAEREREELLSVFAADAGNRDEAEAILDVLVGARLLTEYDAQETRQGAGRQRIEIAHESLLTHWPRLLRWRAKDEEGAVLRDQLRQAARLWDEKDRSEDLLWTGPSYLEYRAWHARYSGGLSAIEEDFARAMTARANRQRHRRRIAGVVVVAAAAAVALATSALWRRSEAARERAQAEALGAEASSLLALGQIELSRYPAAALAYALKSLELSDRPEARLLALRAVQGGPLARVTPLLAVESGAMGSPAFSSNGEWLVFGGWRKAEVFRRGGGAPLVLGGDYPEDQVLVGAFGPSSDILVTIRQGEVRAWSIPEGRELRRRAFEQGPSVLKMGREGFLTATRVDARWVLRSHRLGEGSPRVIGTFETDGDFDFDAQHGSLALIRGKRIYERPLARWAAPPWLLAEHAVDIEEVAYSPDGQRILARDRSGEIRIWPTATRALRPLRVIKGAHETRSLRLDPTGRWLAGVRAEGAGAIVRLWDLNAPRGAEPIALRRGDAPFWNGLAFDPTGRWLASSNSTDGTLWPLGEAHPHVLVAEFGVTLAFTPDGKELVYESRKGTLRSWPLSAEGGDESRVLVRAPLFFPALAMDSASRCVVVSSGEGRLLVVPLDGGPVHKLAGLPSGDTGGGSIALRGHLLAAAPVGVRLEDRRVRLIDIETGAVRSLPQVPGIFDRPEVMFMGVQFLGEDKLLASVLGKGLLVYDLNQGQGRLLALQPQGQFAVGADGRVGVGVTNHPEFTRQGRPGELVRFRVDGGPPEALRAHGALVSSVALDPSGTLVATGSVDGTIRIGRVSGEEPYVLFGHEGVVWKVAFSPDGRWLASGGADRTIRLWPVPDMSKPPAHTMDRERFLAMLRSRTNLRAVLDPQSPSAWRLDDGPFSGWASPP